MFTVTGQLLIAPPQLNPALVGRKSQLALLQRWMEEALESRGSVVAVAGEAGIGKTRLMVEAETGARARGMLFLRGAGDSTRSGLAYGLFVGVLSTYLEHASPSEQSALQETVEELAPHLREVLFPQTHPRLESPASDLNPDLRQTLFLARLAHLLLELVRQRPVVLCLEDLHWADSASLRALHYLATRNADAPLMIVGTYRPEELQEKDGEVQHAGLEDLLRELQTRAHFRELKLERLSSAETRALVSSCFSGSGFGNELLNILYRKTGGIPLFIGQYVEILRDEGVLYERRGLWMDRPIRKGEVPESFHAALQRRMEVLSDEEREVLSYAAVQGQAFETELVARVLGWPISRILRLLERLERKTHLVQRDQGSFCFAHILLLNAFYTHLPETQQRHAHLRLATCLEQHRPADAEGLAYHFYRATAFDQALPYLRKAAQRAQEAFAYWEAHRFLNQSLEALEQVKVPQKRQQRLEVLLAIADIDEALGELNRSVALSQEVLETAHPEKDRESVGWALLQVGWVHHRKGEWESATKHYNQALDIFADLDDARQRATVYVRLGNIAFERSRLDEAAAFFDEARDTARQTEDYALLGGICGNLGVIASVRGRFDEAATNYTEALQTYQKARHRFGICQTYHNLGMTYAAQQEWEEALTCYTEGEKLARDMGTVDVVANILVGRASVQLNLGDPEEAETACQGAHIYYEQMQDRLGLAECEKVEGMICRERGQYAEAANLLRQGKQRFLHLENQLGVAECDLELGLVQQRGKDLEGARRHLQDAAALFEQIGAVAEVRRAKALLASLTS